MWATTTEAMGLPGVASKSLPRRSDLPLIFHPAWTRGSASVTTPSGAV